ncbi:MAG: aspartate-semialdehyde dehydrogenase [Dehalococcoidia bacterium]
MSGYNVAVVGATGAVGRVFLQLLEERRFPVRELRLLASQRSAGQRLTVLGQELEVRETPLSPETFRDVDIAFISVSADLSRRLAPLAVEAGALVIDDSSAFRMELQVPLVVPEINSSDLEGHQGIIAIPNCTTTQLVMALWPLQQANPIRRVVVDTYQAVSGTGGAAMRELREQAQRVLEGREAEPQVYPHQIAFNLLPHIEPFLPDGYTKEERKVLEESRKIMHAPEIAISATCVRVPVSVSHSEAVHVEFTRPMSPQQARELLAQAPGVRVLDDPAEDGYPTPWSVAGTDEVYVGRIRQDVSHPHGLAMWVVADNLRKGAALNALQIAETLIAQGLLPVQEPLQRTRQG